MTTADMLRDIKAQRAARSRYVVWGIALERCAIALYEVGLEPLADELEAFARILRRAQASEAEPEGRCNGG